VTNDQSEYELFISYARRDDRPIPETYPHGWVTALKEHIIADHRLYETSPLRIFFDTHEIRDMDDWRNRILGALRRSKVLLICLSPNYFASQPCRWEWEEYQARQHQKLIGSDSHATVYFVEVPGSGEHENARRLEAIMGKNFTDLRPWFPSGAAAMRDEAVRQRMAALGQSIWQRIGRARRALTVPGNVRGMTPYFVGRNRELAALHRLVGVGKIGLVTTVHGLGGQGKTELAVAYARGYADSYSLGPWSLEAESQKELLPLIGELAFEPQFGYAPTEAEKNDAEKLGLGVLLELGRRGEAARANDPTIAPAALLILDNVSESALLAAAQLSKLPQVDWLRLIATTRLDPNAIDPAHKQLGAVEIDSLDPENALRLIVDHLPASRFATAQDEADAREIVRELGGFTLAIEQVAVFLGLNPPVSPGEYLSRLRANGLPSTDDLVDESGKEQIEHQTKLLRPILESMFAPLGTAGRTLLKLAALLPPERIPWPWLKELTLRHHPELLEDTLPNRWTKLRRQVQGLRLLTGSTDDNTAHMHRLVAAQLRADADDDLDGELRSFVASRAFEIRERQNAPADWELDGLLETIPHLLDGRADQRIAVDGMFLVEKVIAYRSLPAARSLLRCTVNVIQALADADPTSAEKQRDLSISFDKSGDVRIAAGDLNAARGYFDDSLRISRLLADADPTSAQKQRDLSVSFNKLGNVSVAAGDLNAAHGYFDDALRISRLLADADPISSEKQRNLWVSHLNFANLLETQSQPAEALTHWQQALEILDGMVSHGLHVSPRDRTCLEQLRRKLGG
jgi:tetratricopeptide (TPR) repeat protein